MDPENLSEMELRRALRQLLVDSSQARDKPALVALFRKYAKPEQATSAASPRGPPRATASAPAQRNTHGIYVNGKYVPPPQGLGGMINWKMMAVLVLASGVFLSNTNIGNGGDHVDSLGVRGNAHAYEAAGVPAYLNGQVLDVSSHAEFLGALEHHWDVTNLPVVVDFYSPSCGPCRMVAPIFEQQAIAFKGKAVFLKINTQRLQETGTLLGVRALPTFMFFVKGKMESSKTFAGANVQQLVATTTLYANKAIAEGTYVGRTFNADDIEPFLKTHIKRTEGTSDEDFETLVKETTETLLAAHVDKPASFAQALRTQYGATPKANVQVDAPKPTSSKDWLSLLTGIINIFRGQTQNEPTSGETPGSTDTDTNNNDNNHNNNNNNDDTTTTINSNNNNIKGTDVDGVIFLSVSEYAQLPRASNPEQAVIIGGGPAGLSAAIYAGRAGLQPVVISPVFGGQLLGKGVAVENYPGIMSSDPATGGDVVNLMRLQAASFDTIYLNAKLEEIDIHDNAPFVLSITDRNAINDESAIKMSTKTIILATGSNSKWLDVPGEHEYKGRGVTSCATCDGHLYRSSDVAVIGGGDTACEDALVLARTSKSVTLIHRGETLRASNILAKRVLEHPGINVKWNTVVSSFEGNDAGLSHIKVKNTKDGTTEDLAVEAAFIAIGHTPNSNIVLDLLETDDVGYVKVEPHSTRTKIPGIFACGDVADKVYRQAVTSAGTGAMAALDAERWLSEQG